MAEMAENMLVPCSQMVERAEKGSQRISYAGKLVSAVSPKVRIGRNHAVSWLASDGNRTGLLALPNGPTGMKHAV